MKNIRLTSLPDFENVVNLKQYFVMFDGLRNIEYDLAFSVFSKYHCTSGCKICYIQDIWQSDYYDKSKDPLTKDVLEFFSYFELICTTDDLYFIWQEHPRLFEWYQANGSVFSSSAMTDNAFVRQWQILLNQVNFKNISEISFSEEFLATNNWRTAKWVVPRVAELARKYRILKIKVIVSKASPSKESIAFLREMRELGVSTTDVYDDIRLSRNIRHGETDSAGIDYDGNRVDYYGSTYPLFTESCCLQQSKVYSLLSDSTSGSNHFYELGNGFDPSKFIVAVLQSKKQSYARYAAALKGKVSNKHTDYFNYLAGNLTVNPDFNFIPSVMLSAHSTFYSRLCEHGFIDTKFGLVSSKALANKETLVPPISLPASKQKLEYFQVKCQKGRPQC